MYNLLREVIKNNIFNILDLPLDRIRNMTKVFLNGEWLGVIEDPTKLTQVLNKMKNKGEIDRQMVSIIPSYMDNELKIYYDNGRFFRPTIKITNNVINLTKEHINEISLNKINKSNKITDWDEFINKYPDVIEYIDSELQPHLLIAPKIEDVRIQREKLLNSIKLVKDVEDKLSINRYNDLYYEIKTNLEIHPSLLLGEINTGVPFANTNPAARNIFQYSQGRQAMGIYATNYRARTDISYILYHPQKPLVSTRTAKYTGAEMLPSGENVIVAISCYTGLI